MAIPKIVHYCWLSNDPFPDKIKRCIKSWEKFLPDYKIIRWSLNNFDIDSILWTSQAYKAKKYAFAADYIRCFVLYKYGGIYLDSDVEIVKSFDDLLDLPYFLGEEREGTIEAAIMGCERGNLFFKRMLDYYKDRPFLTETGYDLRPLPYIMNDIISKYFYRIPAGSESFIKRKKDNLIVFPWEYFSPKSYQNGRIYLTEKTYAIHHFEASWHTPKQKIYILIKKIFGEKIASFCSLLYYRRKKS